MAESREELRELLAKAAHAEAPGPWEIWEPWNQTYPERRKACFKIVDTQLAALAEAGVAMVPADITDEAAEILEQAIDNAGIVYRSLIAAGRIDKP